MDRHRKRSKIAYTESESLGYTKITNEGNGHSVSYTEKVTEDGLPHLLKYTNENKETDELHDRHGPRRQPGDDARPAAMRNFLAYSLQRLGVDYIDIYRPARVDPAVPIEDTVGAIAEMVEMGHVRHIGLSEVGADTIRRAAAVAPVSDLQIEYSLLSRGIEGEILPVCRELGIGITAYGVLSRGLISGSGSTGGFRAFSPRFQGANRAHNDALVARLQTLAGAKGGSIAQLAIAWVAAQGADIVPVVGARRLNQVQTLIDSARLSLDPDDIAQIEELIPRGAAQGDRYPTPLMAELDSEH